MKKKGMMYLLLGICVAAFCGCSSDYEAGKDTVYIGKKGKNAGVCVSSFEQDYYDAEELSAYIEDTIQEYVASAGNGTVKLESLDTADQTAKAQISYAGYEDYADFNGVEFFVGSVLDAKVAGYELPKKMTAVSDKVTEDYSDEDKVVIIGQTIDVKVNGTITYVSENVTVQGEDLASVAYDSQLEKPELAYIVYQ